MSEFWTVRTTGDDDSVDALLFDGVVAPKVASSNDLLWAAEWLAAYCVDGQDDLELAQSIANAIGVLTRKAAEIDNRNRTIEAKRAYAAAHGIPVSQVRIKR